MIFDDRLDYESAVSCELLDRLIGLISYQLVQGSRVQSEGIVEVRRVNRHILKNRDATCSENGSDDHDGRFTMENWHSLGIPFHTFSEVPESRS